MIRLATYLDLLGWLGLIEALGDFMDVRSSPSTIRNIHAPRTFYF